jgi:hypothetical protein
MINVTVNKTSAGQAVEKLSLVSMSG